MRAMPGIVRTRSQDVRVALVSAAVVVLERDGPPGLTVRAVAKQANVAPMGVYNHLTDKRGLELAIIDTGFAELRDALTGVTTADPELRMYESGLAYRRKAKAHPQVYRLMFGPNLSDPELRHPALALDALVDTIMYAQVAGILRPGSPQVMAKNVWASIHGAIILELETANATDNVTDWDAEYHELLLMIRRGLAPD
jgi:AcrR family transcriptional regulator